MSQCSDFTFYVVTIGGWRHSNMYLKQTPAESWSMIDGILSWQVLAISFVWTLGAVVMGLNTTCTTKTRKKIR